MNGVSTVPLPVARLTSRPDGPPPVPDSEQCGALARGVALSVLPAAGTVSCALARHHAGDHLSRPRSLFGRAWAYTWG